MTYTPREHARSREATKQDLIDILALLGWPPVKSLTVPELRAVVRARAAAAGVLLERERADQEISREIAADRAREERAHLIAGLVDSLRWISGVNPKFFRGSWREVARDLGAT